MSWDSLDDSLARLKAKEHPHWANYLGFYSSWLGGYFREPWGMMLPLDDHGFHRGDAVFEAVRIHGRAYIDLAAHLERLMRSAQAIGMKLPLTIPEIETICVRLARMVGQEQAMLRLYVSRGPGGFSPSPAEVVGHQIYAALTHFRGLPKETYERGVRTLISSVPAKEPFWSRIKSCNYLQNVLMKQECVEKGYDFALALDDCQRVCEGSTENFMLVNAEGDLLVPRFDYTLRGTTALVVMRLAARLVDEGLLRSVRHQDVTLEDLSRAQEAAFVGTTLGVLPATSIDNRPVGSGRPGVVMARLHRDLTHHLETDSSLRTPF